MLRPRAYIVTIFLAIPLTLAAQDENPTLTLHAYTNLMQVPALVVGNDRQPMPSIQKDNFAITLDAGPIFHPSKMRLEGEDPISLAILIDASADRAQLRLLSEDFRRLAPPYLTPRDHVSVYALDCTLFRSLDDVPADPDILATGIKQALNTPQLHGLKNKPACANSLHLWDSVADVTKSVADLPGRRVVLIISPGYDTKSTLKFSEASRYATLHSVAIFGLRNIDRLSREQITKSNTWSEGHLTTTRTWRDEEDPLEVLCGLNGGLVFNVANRDIEPTLQSFASMLRGRYILEFPRPDALTPGFHQIVVTIPGTSAHVRATAASVPIPDPAILNDPNTIPSTPSPAKLGDRHHLPKKP